MNKSYEYIKNLISNILKWIGIILIYYLTLSALGILIKNLNIKSNIANSILMLLSEFIVIFIYIILYRKDIKKDIKQLNDNSINSKFKNSIKIWLTGLFFMIIANSVIINFVSEIASTEEANRTILTSLSFYAIPSMVICAPLCEEIMFRLSFRKIFNSDFLYIILSGLFFGLAHVIGTSGSQLLYIFPYGILGSAFAYIYVKHKNIFLSILMHALHNLICIMLIFI